MEPQGFAVLKERVRQEYAEKHRALDEAMHADLAAIQRAEEIQRRYTESPQFASPADGAIPDEPVTALETAHKDSNGTGVARQPRGELTNAIKQAISQLDNGFSFHDVRRVLNENEPELSAQSKNNALTQVLRKLENKRVIATLVEGKGKRASTYRKATPDETLEHIAGVNGQN